MFRIPNATGTYDSISVTAALSIVVPNGAQLGVNNPADAFRLWVVAFNNAGAIMLGIGRMSAEANSAQIITALNDSAAPRTRSHER